MTSTAHTPMSPLTRRRALVAMTAILALAVPAGPASAVGVDAADPAAILTTAEEGLAPARERVTGIREHLDRGTLLSVVEATATAAGLTLPPLPPAGPPPATLDDVVKEIVAEAKAADAVARRIGRHLIQSGSSDVDAAMSEVAAVRPDDFEHVEGVPQIDPTPALFGAARIARAVDRSLPALRAAAPGSGSGAPDAECDVIDEMPVLCVGGEGPNRYERDAMVLIDLGGDDVFTNSGASATAAAALVLSLGGDDRFETTGTANHAFGGLGGVGMLVNEGGDDLYRITGASINGQGVGSFGGVGLLIDRGGDDRYEVIAEGEISASASAQGVGAFGGVGGLVDEAGNDRYLVRATGFPRVFTGPFGRTTVDRVFAGGQGYAFAGSALVADLGGNDDFDLESTVAPVPSDGPRAQRVSNDTLAEAAVIGQALALIGDAFLVTGSGHTSYVMDAKMGPVPSRDEPIGASVAGQGAAANASMGVLSDRGGNDTYVARAEANSSVSRFLDDESPPGPVEFLGSRVGTVTAYAQGYAVNSLAVLDDHGGDDRYSVEGHNTAQLSLVDERTEEAPSLGGQAQSGLSRIYGQGLATADSLGALVDSGGNDMYSTEAHSTADADGAAELPVNEPFLLSQPGNTILTGQGAGVGRALYFNNASIYGPGAIGALIDLGGRDRYESETSATGQVRGEATSEGTTVHQVQGSVDLPADLPVDLPATGLLVDLGVTGGDVFAQTPPVDTCMGERGVGVWVDCNPVAAGVNGALVDR